MIDSRSTKKQREEGAGQKPNMTSRSAKRSSKSYDDGSLSDGSTSNEGEKTIPFLRRLRDMLVENEDVISFSPGDEGKNILGRIIVHDRVEVEAKVLPRYFNHSSFASLRRQLNYFSFVRLGKGRQRESTYINENVVALDDVLHLKRRSTTSGARVEAAQEKLYADLMAADKINAGGVNVVDSTPSGAPVLDLSIPTNGSNPVHLEHRQKRSRQTRNHEPTPVSPRSLSPLEDNVISEDEHSYVSKQQQQYVALDLTKPDTDYDVLEGCKDLLRLASTGWY